MYIVLSQFHYGRYAFSFLVFFSFVFVYFSAPEEKLLSFESRGVLMMDVIKNIPHNPIALITGYGPDSIISLYSQNRSMQINKYFPESSAIDSSHNIILDVLYSYGVLVLGYVIWTIRNRWSNLRIQEQAGCILGILFFSLNVIVTAPLILLILLIYASTPAGKK